MHPAVRATFLRLFEAIPPPGPRVLEIGAGTDPAQALLTLVAALPGADRECVGIDLAVGAAPAGLPYVLKEMNGNDMAEFADGSFDAVVCNATLEHDRSFWRTIAEVRRILRPGGLFYVGVPGYPRRRNRLQRAALRPSQGGRLGRVPLLSMLSERARLSGLVGVPTLWYHATPRDYYRFSADAVREVFLEDMECIHLEYVLRPVRIVAVGRKSA